MTVQKAPTAAGKTTFADVGADRSNNFDALRFLLATLVLFFHCFALLRGSDTHQLSVLERLASFGGAIAVPFFFVISGYLVTQSWCRTPAPGVFLQKRLLRIYPGFLLAATLGAFVVGPLGTENLAAYWHGFHWLKFLCYLPLLPADVVGPQMSLVFPNLPYAGLIDGSFWTLRYEFECYLLVLGLGLLGLYRRPGVVAILLGALLLVTLENILSRSVWIPYHEYPLVGNPARWLRLVLFFLSGMAFFLFRDHLPFSPLFLGISLVLLASAFIFDRWLDPVLAFFGTYALLYAAVSPAWKWNHFARYGDFSYGVYLYGFPVQQVLSFYWLPKLTPLSLFCAAFPITLALALASWHLVEAPALRRKRGGAQVERG